MLQSRFLSQVGTFGIGVLPGKGDGTFQPLVSYALNAQAIALSAADFSNDGKLDLVATTGNLTSNAVSVLLGNLRRRIQLQSPRLQEA